MEQITEWLWRFPAVDEPVLSADVFVIKGKERNYLFDAGNNAAITEEINTLNPKYIFLSHFHQDHVGKLWNIPFEVACGSSYTMERVLKYKPQDASEEVKKAWGEIQAVKHLEVTDGVNLIFEEIPSTHSKGAGILIINHEIALLGDSIYMEKMQYNVSKLHDMIKALEALDVKCFLCSHHGDVTSKEELLKELRGIYAMREKNQPYIKLYKGEEGT